MLTSPKATADEKGFLPVLLIIGIVLVVALVLGFNAINHKTGLPLKISNGCKDTDIAISPVTLATADTPATFTAKLTAGGQPVSDHRLTFFLRATDQRGYVAGGVMGYATTDSNGTATLKQSAGISTNLLPGDVVKSYEVEYSGDSSVKPNKTFYCGSHADADLTVH